MTKAGARRIIKDALERGRLPSGGLSISAIPIGLFVLLADAQIETDENDQIIIYTGRVAEDETPL